VDDTPATWPGDGSLRIGVIMPAFNVAPWIGQAIASVVAQCHTDWSLIVVDDGSTDATPDVALRQCDSRITVLRQMNRGVSAARNRGMAAIDPAADALLFLDADDWLEPEALAVLAGTLRAAPAAVAAAGCYARIGTDGARRPVRVRATGDVLRRLMVRNLFANGGHLLIRRHAIQAAGSFDPSLSYGEDWHYWIRIAASGPFVAARDTGPLLNVRERPGSACHAMAHQPDRFRLCLDAIHRDGLVQARLAPAERVELRRRAEAENAWVIGRELIRHGEPSAGRKWLLRSLREAPGAKRLGLLALSWTQAGPFRPYAASASTRRRGTACTGIAA
jgi:glycosyltransferase involved in cell wall biosynthesis